MYSHYSIADLHIQHDNGFFQIGTERGKLRQNLLLLTTQSTLPGQLSNKNLMTMTMTMTSTSQTQLYLLKITPSLSKTKSRAIPSPIVNPQ